MRSIKRCRINKRGNSSGWLWTICYVNWDRIMITHENLEGVTSTSHLQRIFFLVKVMLFLLQSVFKRTIHVHSDMHRANSKTIKIFPWSTFNKLNEVRYPSAKGNRVHQCRVHHHYQTWWRRTGNGGDDESAEVWTVSRWNVQYWDDWGQTQCHGALVNISLVNMSKVPVPVVYNHLIALDPEDTRPSIQEAVGIMRCTPGHLQAFQSWDEK